MLIRCQVRNQESGSPQLVAVSSAVGFGNLDLSIHSYSADWLYQALLYVFSGVIRSQIEGAVDNAMHTVSQQRGRGPGPAVGTKQRVEIRAAPSLLLAQHGYHCCLVICVTALSSSLLKGSSLWYPAVQSAKLLRVVCGAGCPRCLE